ncbi:glycosyltransferase family 2 protein [Nocardia caishijiensis]|uniref:glycosyltransferase family 2 protein n=1 Tax=Nocardia caishijiensis TaxID=184756 RepID=UPI000AFD9AFB|nr:glycosyltransferase family A protein [Nocardia caishijiensis]
MAEWSFVEIAVLTAVHAGYARYLPDAWRSLCAQTHADWTWYVQVDGGRSPELVSNLIGCGAAGDPRVSLAFNGTREGSAVTRNVALGRITVPLVQNLDADDELEPTALATLGAALAAEPTAGFAVGPARDLLGSGELRSFPLNFRPGLLERGALLDAWVTNAQTYRLPVHPAGVLWRRDLLLAAGGWAALRGMEDTALLMSASAMAAGVVVDAPTLRYRKHHLQQSSKHSIFEGGGEQISLIRARAAALLLGPEWAAPSLR